MITKPKGLFNDSQWNYEIKKHSWLVHIDNRTSLQQRKAINAIIRIAKDQLKRNPDKRIFTVDLGLIKNMAWISRKDNTELKQALRQLVTMAIEYNILKKDKEDRWVFSFLSAASIESETQGKSAVFKFELPTPIIDAIKRPNIYVKLNLLIARWLSSKHSLTLYEILKDYQNLWKIRFYIENLRRLLWIKPEQYKIFTMFRKRVIDTAIKEINWKTDIFVSYELEKKRKGYESIYFKVERQENNTGLHIKDDCEIIETLKRFGFKEHIIKRLLDKYDKPYISANIAVVERMIKKGKKINSLPAYLTKAFQIDFREPETEHTRLIKAKEMEKQEKAKKNKEKEDRINNLKNQFKRQLVEKTDKIVITLEKEQLENLKTKFEDKVRNNSLISKIFNEKGYEHQIIKSNWQTYLIKELISDEERSFDNYLDRIK